MSGTLLTIIGFGSIFLATTLGAALVFFFKKEISGGVNALLLGFAAGIMLAASVWSLLIPSIDGATEFGYGRFNFLPAVAGFIFGGIFLVFLDGITPKISGLGEKPDKEFEKRIKTFIAITVHNVPEGLAVGFAFGGAALIGTTAAFLSALGLTMGIAIQNFPEGAAVSLPLKAATGKSLKSFLFGSLSGAVEPVAAVIGYYLASTLTVLQPWLLSFAAGAMVFVVAEDLIPDARYENSPHLGTWGVMAGFVIMMALDVALG